MTKIYEIEGHGILAQTDIERKVILMNKNLRKYPDLRKFVLRHEKQHLKENSYFKAFILDIKDYPVLYSNLDFWKFHDKYVSESWGDVIYGALYHIGLFLSVPIMGLYCQIKLITKHLRRK